MKFPFKKQNKPHVWDCFGDIDMELLRRFLDGVKVDKDMELIIREKIDWDAIQMKKYFEGPVVAFFQQEYARKGIAFGEGNVREGLLGMFLGWSEPNQFGQKHALSRTELDTPRDGFSPRQRWTKFLLDIGNYSKDEFGCDLPTYDNTDVGD